MSKRCTKCRVVKPLSEFGQCAVFADGLTYDCRECHNASRRKWAKDNRAKSTAAENRYRVANPEFCLYVAARYRAKKRGLPFTITRKDIVIPEFCPVLGIKLQKSSTKWSADSSPSLDAFIPESGYAPENIAVISHKANTIKSNGTAEDLEKVAAWMRSREG